jgi:hypothetical protein
MKILTVRQPWASAIFNQGKDIENHCWTTPYRGPLIIQASQKPEKLGIGELAKEGQKGDPYVDPAILKSLTDQDFPDGRILGVVDLYCIVKESDSNWADPPAPRLHHWCLRNPRKLKVPIPFKGRLGLFDPPPDVVRAINKIL